jgi:FtsZ-binding cell division protein ZapB
MSFEKELEKAAETYAETNTYCDSRYTAKAAFLAGASHIQAQRDALEAEVERIKEIARGYEERLSKYECHHGYRLDGACISSNCDSVNHTKEKL